MSKKRKPRKSKRQLSKLEARLALAIMGAFIDIAGPVKTSRRKR